VAAFNLDMITSAKVLSTVYDQSAKRWVVKFQTPSGQRTAVAKHLVQATGIGSQKPYLPRMAEEGLYKSINIHSAEYNNPAKLKEKGVKASLLLPARTPFSAAREN
jgi:cation diffusion facilitator CzcD-associated flavoprotein CzcO